MVVIGALSDGSKTVLSVVPGYRESTESWSDVPSDLRDRGMNCPKLVVGDGHLGIWGALANGVSGSQGAEVLEPQGHKRARSVAEAPAGSGQADASEHPVRRESC